MATNEMKSEQLIKELDEADALYIGLNLRSGGKPIYMKWREKSEAMRRRVRKLVTDAAKDDPKATFQASVSNAGGEKILIIGDHIS